MSHTVDWRYDMGEDVYVIIKTPQLTIHIRKNLGFSNHPSSANSLFIDDVTVNTTSQVQ
jgi:hypothetical protein